MFLEIFSTPLGSPKYIPLVSSLMIIISRSDIISSFRLDAETKASKTIAGLKFANKSSSFLIFSKPLSGLLMKSNFSHFGPPTAPKSIASDFFARFRTLFVIGSPYSSIDAPPISSLEISNSKLVFLSNQLKIFSASFEIS